MLLTIIYYHIYLSVILSQNIDVLENRIVSNCIFIANNNVRK